MGGEIISESGGGIIPLQGGAIIPELGGGFLRNQQADKKACARHKRLTLDKARISAAALTLQSP